MNNKSTDPIRLNKKENYIISVAVSELGGPYHKVSRFYKHLTGPHQQEYDEIQRVIDQHMGVYSNQIPLVLDALYLMNETDDTDFLVICRNDIKNSTIGTITRDDVKFLCDKLEKIYNEHHPKVDSVKPIRKLPG